MPTPVLRAEPARLAAVGQRPHSLYAPAPNPPIRRPTTAVTCGHRGFRHKSASRRRREEAGRAALLHRIQLQHAVALCTPAASMRHSRRQHASAIQPQRARAERKPAGARPRGQEARACLQPEAAGRAGEMGSCTRLAARTHLHQHGHLRQSTARRRRMQGCTKTRYPRGTERHNTGPNTCCRAGPRGKSRGMGQHLPEFSNSRPKPRCSVAGASSCTAALPKRK